MKNTRYFDDYQSAYNYYGGNIVPSNEIALIGNGSYIFVSSDNAVSGNTQYYDANLTNDEIVDTMTYTAYNNGVTYGEAIGFETGYTAGTTYGEAIGYAQGYEGGYSYGYSYGYTEGEAAGGTVEDPNAPIVSCQYLTFTAQQANSTLSITRVGSYSQFVFEGVNYSTDGGQTWQEYTLDTVITLANIGDKVIFSGSQYQTGYNGSNYHKFVMTGLIAASGSLSSIQDMYGVLKYNGVEAPSFGFYKLFENCIALTSAPILPWDTMNNYCYASMFEGCTSLTAAPELPATTLAQHCYANMFSGCTALTVATELPATTLATSCYNHMFNGCTSLTTPPSTLPATTLTNYCYQDMFTGCTSLTVTPTLPAATMAQQCYNNMFSGCTSLTTAPDLISPTLDATQSHMGMFMGCTNLTYVKCLATSITGSEALFYWLYEVSPTGTFVKDANMTFETGESGIPAGWTVTDAA